jgi:hypothetical protein
MLWPVGDTHTRIYIQALSDTSFPVDLTGATVTAKVRLNDQNTVYTALTGQSFVINPTQGVFSWKFSTSDVQQSGVYKMVFSANYGTDVWNSLL